MGRMYTMDHKLLIDTPEVRIGDKIFPVDDRQKTARKIMELIENRENKGEFELMDEVVAVALGEKNAKEIDKMNLPFKAQQIVYELVIAAVLGEEPEEVHARFQKSEKTADK